MRHGSGHSYMSRDLMTRRAIVHGSMWHVIHTCHVTLWLIQPSLVVPCGISFIHVTWHLTHTAVNSCSTWLWTHRAVIPGSMWHVIHTCHVTLWLIQPSFLVPRDSETQRQSWPEYSIIHNPFSSSLARRSTFCKFQDNLEISFMDTNGDLRIMPHVGHLRRMPGFVRGLCI